MNYKVRVFFEDTHEEAFTVNDTYESKESAQKAIDQLKTEQPESYEYVLIPVPEHF